MLRTTLQGECCQQVRGKRSPERSTAWPRSQSVTVSARTTPTLIPRPLSFCSSPHCAHSLPSGASVPQEEKYRRKTVTNTMKSNKLETLKMRKGRKKGEREGRRRGPAPRTGASSAPVYHCPAPITIIIITDIINTSWGTFPPPSRSPKIRPSGPGIQAETAAINNFGSGSKDTSYLT